jgi:hypothetical protein
MDDKGITLKTSNMNTTGNTKNKVKRPKRPSEGRYKKGHGNKGHRYNGAVMEGKRRAKKASKGDPTW